MGVWVKTTHSPRRERGRVEGKDNEKGYRDGSGNRRESDASMTNIEGLDAKHPLLNYRFGSLAMVFDVLDFVLDSTIVSDCLRK